MTVQEYFSRRLRCKTTVWISSLCLVEYEFFLLGSSLYCILKIIYYMFQDCNEARNVKCRKDDVTLLLSNGCPADFQEHRLLSHETDCTKYYKCNFGIKFEMICSAGLHFHFEKQVCYYNYYIKYQRLTLVLLRYVPRCFFTRLRRRMYVCTYVHTYLYVRPYVPS